CHDPVRHSPDAEPVDAPQTADAPPPSPPDPAAALAALPGSCSNSGWCWYRPTPSGNTVEAIYATAPDNLWVIGDAGTVLQWNGTSWRSPALPAPPFRASMNLGMVHGRGPDDMWVAGLNEIYHWDGAAWTLVEYIPPEVDQRYYTIWEAPDGQLWVGMDYGV